MLAAEKTLQQLGMEEAAFDRAFEDAFGSLKCDELRRLRHSCNDLVGTAARLAAVIAG